MHDVLVVGLGAMGSATLYHLASLGARVAGVDRYDPPHALGSTHGRSRIIREAYYEHPDYVPLVRRAYENWSALERDSGARLFEQTGGLMMGAPDSGLVRGASESAALHGLDVEHLSAGDIQSRFPAYMPQSGMVGVYERRAGVLFPEACVDAHLRLAEAHGAVVHRNTRIAHFESRDGGLVAHTPAGTIAAKRAVIAAGPWSGELLAPLGVSLKLVTERQTMHWLDSPPHDERFGPRRLPIMLVEHAPDRYFYTIPDFGDGLKAAIHHEGMIGPIDEVSREVTVSDTGPALALARQFVPDAPSRIRESAVCVYTNSPDLHFVVDALPSMPNVTLVSACSGHGFKFASAIGEIVARRSLGVSSDVDASRFALSRFD